MTDTSTTAIVWIRLDQRLSDNPALLAGAKHRHLVPVFIWPSTSGEEWDMGGASRWWLHHSLCDLDSNLKQKGSALIVAAGDELQTLEKLIKQTKAGAVYWNRRYEPESIERDGAIKTKLTEQGIHVQSFNGSLLNEPWEVAKKDGTPYLVYTPYWKVASQQVDLSDLGKRLTLAPLPSPTPPSLTIASLGLLPKIPWDAGFPDRWQPGETQAKKNLKRFLEDAMDSYDSGRNLPAVRGTSSLSPYLHFGNISPKQVWQRVVKTQSKNNDVTQYLKELVWREFAYHLLYHFPQTTKAPLREAFNRFPWKKSPAKLKKWQQGLTGFPIVDAGMRELWATGWMHNRVRMIAASFLVKDLQIHWTEGAKWFWDTLVDADLAANTMGWQWVSGCGADAAPYFRIFNPMLQGSKFDPEGAYTKKWLPELKDLPAKYLQAPWEAPKDVLEKAGVKLGDNYPKPLVDHFVAKDEAMAGYNTIKAKT